jgi:acyl-CoA thioesterase FadM
LIDGRYAKEFLAGWATMDFNGHMANTAYLNWRPTCEWRSSPNTGSRRANSAVELPLPAKNKAPTSD